jgi:alkylation response protein AidB-like acyl-CoA dehydrogenase
VDHIVSEGQNIVAETAARIFADLADPQTINNAKSDAWRRPLWQALTDAGLTLAWVPEEQGGSGASVADGFEVLSVAGQFALSIPLGETMLAGWLLAQAGLTSPEGAMSVAPMRPSDRIALNAGGTLSGRARGVPFARDAQHLVVLAHGPQGVSIAMVEAKAARLTEGQSLAADPLGIVTFDHTPTVSTARAPQGFDQAQLMLMGAVVRSVQTAGALEAVLGLSVRYANERVAFERPIAKFQAVQHNLAQLAGQAAAAMAAAGSAADALARGGDKDELFLEAASAKIRSAEAAEEGARIAHQVHGAIGFTEEHILHRFTLRMLSWRDDFGNESHWAAELGKRVLARGADEFWPLIASR